MENQSSFCGISNELENLHNVMISDRKGATCKKWAKCCKINVLYIYVTKYSHYLALVGGIKGD